MKLYSLLVTLASSSLLADASCAFLPSARPCVKSDLPDQSNVYTQFSYLYWDCAERGLDFALKNTQPQFNSMLTVHEPGFDWKSAFRFQVGTHLPFDHWNLDFTYSFFYNRTIDRLKHNFDISSSSAFGSGILSVWTSPGAFLSENIYARWQFCEAKWKIHAHFFDLFLRHDLFNGYALSFQPAFGVKMALLQQRYVVAYRPGNIVFLSTGDPETLLSSTINMNNRSLNVGPGAGCQTRWCISPHWNIFGSLSGSLLAAHFEVGRDESDFSTTTSTVIGSYRVHDEYWTYRPQGTAVLGIQWNDCSCNKQSVIHYGFSASYEAQYWWKQNMLLRHYDAPAAQSQTMAPALGDLFFQGLAIDLLFDF
jgi:hypothetical protein